MVIDPRKSRSFRFNLDLVMAEIGRWPIATVFVLTILAAAIVVQDSRLNAIEIAFFVAGYLLGALGLKALMLLMIYPRLHKAAFPGSHLVASYITFVPIFAFYAAGFHALSAEIGEDPPLVVMIPFMLFAYLLFSVFFAGSMRALHTILMHKGRLSDLTRKGARPAPSPSDQRPAP